jgi:broad specificity phosphatase PhoE
MHLYIIRHADPYYGHDTLTPQGLQEAKALAERLATHGVDYIYTSDAVRAILTARPTADILGLSYQILPWLLEPGHLRIEQQGRIYSLWDTFGETVRAETPLPTQYDWFTRFPFDDPEVIQMWQTFREQCNSLIAQHGYVCHEGRYAIRHANRDRIALFCHNGTVLLLLAHLLELPLSLVWCGFYSWPSSVTTIYFEEHSKEWAVPRALGVADVSHLYAAGLRPQPRGMGDRYEAYD